MAAGLRALGDLDRGRRPTTWQVTPGPLRRARRRRRRQRRHRHALPAAGGRAGRRRRPLRRRPAVPRAAAGAGGRARCATSAPTSTATRDRLPLTVHGRGWLRGGSVDIDASLSSQFVSALLLAAPRFADALEVRHERRPAAVRAAHRHDRRDAARGRARSSSTSTTHTWRVAPGPLHGRPACDRAGPVQRRAVPRRRPGHRRPGHRARTGRCAPPRPATRCATSARGWAPRSTTTRDGLTVTGPDRVERRRRRPAATSASSTPVLAAVAALADGPSRLRGIAHLRRHETDRLAALATEITALGGDVRETDDGLEIRPRPLHGGLFHTYDDHRMATAARCSGCACRASRSRTSRRRPRPCRTSSTCGPGCCA